MSRPQGGPFAGSRIRLVVLTHNGREHVMRCLKALEALEYPGGEIEIVLVDNDSTDGTVGEVADRFPDVEVIARSTNTGFGANNVGLGELGEIEAVGLVNPDTALAPDALQHLVLALRADRTVGAVVPKMLLWDDYLEVPIGPSDTGGIWVHLDDVRVDGISVLGAIHLVRPNGTEQSPQRAINGRLSLRVPMVDGSSTVELVLRGRGFGRVDVDGEVIEVAAEATTVRVGQGREPRPVLNGCGLVIFDDGHAGDRGLHQFDEGQFDEPVEVVAWSGATVLLRPSYVDDVGMFEPRYFLYYEDLDLSWRGRSRGWRYRTVPKAVVRHRRGALTRIGSDLVAHHVERNRLWTLVRNAPLSLAVREYLRHPLVSASYARSERVRSEAVGDAVDLTVVRRRLKAYGAALGGTPWALRERHRLRQRSKGSHAWVTEEMVRRVE